MCASFVSVIWAHACFVNERVADAWSSRLKHIMYLFCYMGAHSRYMHYMAAHSRYMHSRYMHYMGAHSRYMHSFAKWERIVAT